MWKLNYDAIEILRGNYIICNNNKSILKEIDISE